ncbi:hypothetical protein P879_00746 [Paragonimus westermani]|uniref:Neurobeachin n=1 Tax=Paragonimus westermani TaxID=34504 RepID=A0A8T0DUG2_9TREM|nr:hypothetical protein P879_00746 [Paragonimus westermani]
MPSKSPSLTLVPAHTENVDLSVCMTGRTNDSELDIECLANFFSTLYSCSNCLCLVLSPITRWPQKSGWSFNCWCFIEADEEGSNLLYSFLNKDGLGFTAHVEKNVLILTIIRLQGKGIQYRVPADILFGQISLLDASWHFGSELLLNRCSIGGSLGTSTRGTSFCGLLTNLMGFTVALSPEQIDAIYTLGVEYQGQFCFETECQRDLSDSHRRLLYGGGHLRNSLMFAYIPSACDRNLCLNRAPKCLDVFAHSSHAIMNGEVKSVHRTSVTGALHCLGGIQVLYPLFERLDCPISTTDIEGSQGVCPSAALVPMVSTTESASHDEESIAVILLDLLFTLVRSSPPMGRQLVQTRGLLLLASALRSASVKNLSLLLLSRLIEVARELVSVADLAKSGTFNPGVHMHSSFVFTMLRHLHGYVFCNPDLWIRAPIEVQDQLYQFLAAEFLPNVVRHGCVNRTTTVLQSIYTLKYYYSLTDPRSRSGFQLRTTDHLPLSNPQDVLKLRANLLIYIRQLIIRLGVCLDAEMQALFSYFMTVQEDENLHDVLYLFVTLVVAHPGTVGPVFMRNNGLHVAFKLLTSNDEHNRIYAIKLIGFHLQQSKLSKRNDLMERYHLFTMLADRLSQFSESISMLTYNALFEVLVDQLTTRPQLDPLAQIPPDMVIKNPSILRVLSNLIHRSRQTPESVLVKQIFLQHLIALCARNLHNRRTILQQSVWQDCILKLTTFYPTSESETLSLACVLNLFRLLLFHAIRYEQDGWRVWTDTLALLHLWLEKTSKPVPIKRVPNGHSVTSGTLVRISSRAALSDTELDLTEPVARRLIGKLTDSQNLQPSGVVIKDDDSAHDNSLNREKVSESLGHERPVRLRQSRGFFWSHIHQILLDDLLYSIEEELGVVSARSISYYEGCAISSVRCAKYGFTRDEVSSTQFVGGVVGLSLDATDTGQNYAASNAALTLLQDPVNRIFALNLTNLLSDCTDVLVGACGGLLPLLAAATTASGDVGVFESIEGLSVSDAMTFVLRIAFLVDVCTNHLDLGSIEKDRNMASGVLVRQFTRLYLMAAVRNCLESRFFHLQPSHEILLQLKSFTNSADGVRFVPLISDMCAIQSADEVNSSCSAQDEADITTHQDHYNGFHYPSLIRGLVDPASEVELESLATRLFCLTKLLSPSAVPLESRLGFAPSPWRFMNFLSTDHLLLLNNLKQRHIARLGHLPRELHRLIFSLRPTLHYPVVHDKTFLKAVIQPLADPQCLLQARDLNRLQGIIFKSEELQRVPEFLAMSVAYFICVLMVSKYRDILEPSLKLLTNPDSSQVVNAQSVNSPALTRSDEPVTESHSSSENLEAEHQIERPPSDVQTASSLTDSDEDDSSDEGSVADPPITVPLEKVEIATLPRRSHRVNDNRITEELNATLSSTASFLRDLFQDFSSHFSKNLVGSQGQALLTSGLATLRDSQSVVELVMLLCSQEWQSSLQKNAGLAFIELINEGRVLSRVIREHVLSVTAEAVALLDRLARADIKSHAEFDQITARLAANKREDARMCEHVITSARLHDQLSTLWLTNKMHRLMTHLWSNWSARLNRGSKTNNTEITEFYRLDNWEDDSRRRRRLSPNPHGSTHPYAVLNHRTEKTANRPTVPQLSIEAVLKQTGAASGYGEESTDDSDSGVIDLVDGQADTPQTSNSQLSSAQRRRASFDSVDLSIQLEGLMDSMDVGLTADDDVRFAVPCLLVSFGIGVRGVLSVGRSELQFERDLSHSGTQPLDKKVLVYVESACNKWSFSEIHAVFTRRYLHRTVALELFVTSRSSIFLAFENTETLRRIVSALPPVGIGSKYGLARSRATTLASPRQLFTQSNMTQRWQRREISNFDYLMYLNTISGRTYNDLNQYPIFPWILANYTSEELELNEPSNYRDLSKPIGALDPNRKAYFDERYASWEDDSQPPFHYGTHYSTAAFVLSYLLRLEPFTTLFLHLQDGKFDHPDRLFSSIGRTWDNCQRNTSDVKELIPEFFYLPEMFENSNHFNLGVTEDGEEVGEVKLPKWATTPEQFVRIHRQALESELVSCQLHHWIDLIFGYKQRGPEAVLATNVFHHLTYEGSVDWSKLTDPLLVQAVQDQIQSFGQTPSQLLRSPHPHRNSALHLDPLVFTPLAEEVCMIYKFYSNAPVVFVASQTDNVTGLSHPAVVTVTANRTVVLTRWNNTAADAAYQTARVHPIRAQNSSVTSSARHGTDQSLDHPNVGTTTDKNDSSAVGSEQPAELHLPGEGCNTIGQPSSEPASHKSNNTVAAQNSASPQSNYLLTSDLISSQASHPYTHCLGDDFDLILPAQSNQFLATTDLRILFVCGHDDCSFRLYSLETGRIVQAVYGHFGVVTCLSHSECNSGDHCYLVSGSRDCTVKLWIYDARRMLVLGDQASASASSLVSLIGHEAEITSVAVSAELGLILSGSDGGTCLLHSTRGELLRQIYRFPVTGNLTTPDSFSRATVSRLPVRFLSYHREGYLVVQYGPTNLTVYTLNGKQIQSSDLIQLAAASNYQITGIIFSACGRYLLISGNDGVVWVLRSHDLSPVHAFPRCDASVRSLCLTRDQRFLIVGLSSGSLVIFYVDFGQWHHEFQERYTY